MLPLILSDTKLYKGRKERQRGRGKEEGEKERKGRKKRSMFLDCPRGFLLVCPRVRGRQRSARVCVRRRTRRVFKAQCCPVPSRTLTAMAVRALGRSGDVAVPCLEACPFKGLEGVGATERPPAPHGDCMPRPVGHSGCTDA